jgi:multiple sugar transport system substrate-binding protein
MKHLFLLTLLVLAASTIGTVRHMPEQQSEVPVIYWVTDPNPARVEQVRTFHEWLVKNGYTREDDPTKPCVELEIDSANNDISKRIIQCVSRVGGDIMDFWSPSGDMSYFNDMGLVEDVTEVGIRLGFDPSQTWPSMESEITLPDGKGGRRQYMFPCNVATSQLWVNCETFRRFGLEVPPARWTFDEFERRGKEFVEVANRGLSQREFFFSASVDLERMYRSLGLSKYNETLTRCTLDDPRYVRVLKLLDQWTYEDRILPTDDEIRSFETAASYTGPVMALFNEGNFAMFKMGRYALIQLRKYGSLDLSVSEIPHGGYPNIEAATRSAAIYKGSQHKELAALFLKFLASEDYNAQIVADADAHPPNPRYAETDAFNRPPDHPNEWVVHARFAEGLRTISIGSVFSPYVAPRAVTRLIQQYVDEIKTRETSPEQCAQDTAKAVNREMERTLDENPGLRDRYREAVERQKKIDKMIGVWREIDRLEAQNKPVNDALRKRAKKIPLDLIGNAFYRRYYADKGWAE